MSPLTLDLNLAAGRLGTHSQQLVDETFNLIIFITLLIYRKYKLLNVWNGKSANYNAFITKQANDNIVLYPIH